MMEFTFTFVIVLLAVWPLQAQRPNHLPNSNCTFDWDQLHCLERNLDIPVDFDVNLVPGSTKQILLMCPTMHTSRCNTLREECEPLPFRAALTAVRFYGFRTTGSATPYPYLRFIQNVKHQLTWFQIELSQVGYLDKEFFRGFRALNQVNLHRNDIGAISPDAFQLLAYPLVPAMNVSIVPKLAYISLQENFIREIDWSVFEPLAQNLEHLHLNQWTVRSMERSGKHFTLSLVSLRMSHFDLPTIPKRVLSTLTPRDPIAPSLAQQAKNRDWNFRTPKICPSSSNCSCCEMKDFLEWAGKFNKPTSQRRVNVLFMCGGANGVNYDQTSQFPLDLHAHCAEPVKISKPVVCYKPPPIEVECAGNLHLTTSEPDLRRTDATSLRVSADSSFRCRTFLYNIHSKILQMAKDGVGVNQTAARTVTATCNNGTVSVDMWDAYSADVTKLAFDSDASTYCRDKFHLFLNFVYAQKDPQNLYEDVVPTIIPVDRWINEFQICADTPPLTLTCNNTVVAFPKISISSNNSTKLLFDTNQVFHCRKALNKIHKYLLEQNNTIVEDAVEQSHTDSLIVVCQKGQIVISRGIPEQSTFANIEYYSAPNQLCRNAFDKFVNRLTELLMPE